MTKFKFLFFIALLVGFATLAYAGGEDLQDFQSAFSNDFPKLLKENKPLAEQGDVDAGIIVGNLYYHGLGVPQDYGEAAQWYRKAAEGNFGKSQWAKFEEPLRTKAEGKYLRSKAEAQKLLGAMYQDGLGVPKDYAEAVKWYRKAAEQGDAPAQFELAELYKGVPGVRQDFAEVVRWYREAAEQGYRYAQLGLGARYEDGESVPQDFVKAHMWYNLAAERGLAFAAQVRDMLAARMTPSQIAEAQRLAREWKPSSIFGMGDTDTKKPVSATEEYKLQEWCKNSAAEFVQDKDKDLIRTGAGNYTNHYNRKLNKCFVAVEAVIELTGRTSKTLWDINDNKEYGWFISSLIDPDKAADCSIFGKPCKSESEWDLFVKSYMEE